MRDRRQKASDVFRETPLLFGKPGRFADAFPTIATLRVVTKSSGNYEQPVLGFKDDGKRYYDQSSAGEYIDCRNPSCYNGGFNLGEPLRLMVQTGETHREWTVGCQGYEDSPKGRKKYRSCLEHWSVAVDVTYKAGAL